MPALRSETIRRYVASLSLNADLDSFLKPRLSSLTPPDAMTGRQETAQRIAQAIRAGEKIAVFGDYDCDGMTATAIMSDIIEALGGTVTAHLASRFEGGYGFSDPALDRVLASEPQLLITCDCGSSDHPRLERARRAGLDVIVIDHHLVPDEPLPVLAFLNPHQPDCEFPFKHMASCGLALSVGAALRKEMKSKLDIRAWLDLVAIGSIADVVPLVGDNRVLVRAGLEVLRKAERPGIRALLDVIGLDRSSPFSAEDVAFRIAPRLNAPGRLQEPDAALAVLRAKQPVQAAEAAALVEELCQRRREDQKSIEAEAEAQVISTGQDVAPGIVVGDLKWNHGIVGIIAGRLAEKYGRPAIVIGSDGVGSVRGPGGFPLYDALAESAEHLLRFGGHQAAAGISIEMSKLADFTSAFHEAVARRKDYERPKAPKAWPIVPEDDLFEIVQDLQLLEPCGEKNPAPHLEVYATVRSAREVKGGHLKLDLVFDNGARVSAFAPGKGHLRQSLKGKVRVRGSLRPDRYRGGRNVEMMAQDVSLDV